MSLLQIGKVRPTHKGVWSTSVTYEALDWVTYKSFAYQALIDVPMNREPDVSPGYWVQTGMKGDKGDKGTTGAPGPAGADGRDGAEGIQGPLGLPPQHKWEDSSLSFKNTDGTWGSPADLRGSQGVQGPAGPNGLQGIQGPVGPQGPTGAQGPKGEVGPTPELSDAVNSSLSSVAASSKATKTAYDKGVEALGKGSEAAQAAVQAMNKGMEALTKANAVETLTNTKAPGGFGLGSFSATINNPDNALSNGWYCVEGNQSSGAPVNSWGALFVITGLTDSWIFQTYYCFGNSQAIYFRARRNWSWSGWAELSPDGTKASRAANAEWADGAWNAKRLQDSTKGVDMAFTVVNPGNAPQYIWGTSDGTNSYVYTPGSLGVARAWSLNSDAIAINPANKWDTRTWLPGGGTFYVIYFSGDGVASAEAKPGSSEMMGQYIAIRIS